MSQRVTVLISDIEGSTAYTQDRGDESAMDLIRAHERLTRDAIGRHGGTEIKSMGDGFMVTFETPATGIACALDIAHVIADHNGAHPSLPLRVRIGVHAGPVIEEGGDIYGTTVNAASRIVAKARSGQVLVSEAVHDLAGDGDWHYIDRGLFWLKGLRERWRLYEATRDSGIALDARAPSGRAQFVDREDERAALRLYVDAALDGRGGLVLLTGEAGAGKTRLAEEVGVEAAGRGLRVVVGRCFEATRTHPLAPFIDIIEGVERDVGADRFRVVLGEAAPEIGRIVPNLTQRLPGLPAPAELPPEQARRFLFVSLREVLNRLGERRPLLVHIDDLQWADEQSLLFLEHIAGDLETLPVLIIGTYPDGGPESNPALRDAIGNLERRRAVERITIGSLTKNDSRSLIASLVGGAPSDELVNVVYSETDGNPFFLEEVVLHLLDNDGLRVSARAPIDVPESVRLTVGRRLDVLSPATRSVLTTAAIIGRAFGFDLLEVLAETDEDSLLDSLDEAERARVITSSQEGGYIRFRFAHELIRQTLVADVSLARRQLLHLSVADALERLATSSIDDRAADIAYHLVEAGRRASPERTVHFLLVASDRALHAAAFEEAMRHLQHALTLLGSDEREVRARILERLAAALRSLGRPDEAIARWDEACEVYATLGDDESVARLCLDAAIQVSWWQNRPDTLALIERGLQAAGDGAAALRAGLLAMSAVISSHLGSYEDAVEKLDRASTLARTQNNRRVLGIVLYTKTAHHFNYREHDLAVDTGRDAIEHLRAAGDLWNLANVQGFVGQSLGFLGRFEEASLATEGAKQLAERLGNWVAYVYIDRARAWRYMSRSPDPAIFDRDGQRDVDLGAKLGYGWMSSLGYTRRSFAAFIQGRWEEALELAERSASYERGMGHGHLGRLVLLNAYLGNADASLEAFERLRRFFPKGDDPAYAGAWDSFMAAIEGMVVLEERERVAELTPLLHAHTLRRQIYRGWDYRLIASTLGMAAVCTESYAEAERHFEEAVALADGLPFVLEQPDARRFYAWMLASRNAPGDAERARGLLDAAKVIYHSIGMPRHEALADALLVQIA